MFGERSKPLRRAFEINASHYILDLEVHDREGPFAQLTEKLRDRDGHPLKNLEKPLALHEIRKGVDVRDVGDAFVRASNRDRLGDFLWHRVHGNVAFSTEVVRALDADGVRIDPGVYRWPLHVVGRFGTPRRDYFFMWALKHWPVLDLAEAEVTFFPGTDVIQEVTRWVLDPDQTPDYDLFATPYFRWLVSDRFVEVIRRGRFSGFSFIPINGP